MPNNPDSTAQIPETVYRTVRLRLYPGDAATGILLTAIAGACRYVWNHLLADQERCYRLWQAYRIGPKPVPTFFTLGQRFTELRNDPDHAWLRDYPFACVRYSLKYLADAYKRYLKDPQTEGKPRFKARHGTVPAFTIPEAVKKDGDRLRVPKVGWLRLSGSDPYAGCQPLTVRIRMEGTARHPSGMPTSATQCLRSRCDREPRTARSAWTATWGRPPTATAPCTRCPTRSGWTRRSPASSGNSVASRAGDRRTSDRNRTAGDA